MKPIFKNITEVGIVVKSVSETIRTYVDKYGIGPWEIWELNSTKIKNLIVNGKNSAFKLRRAAHNFGGVTMELIEPQDDFSKETWRRISAYSIYSGKF